jgi:hypothetical protein
VAFTNYRGIARRAHIVFFGWVVQNLAGHSVCFICPKMSQLSRSFLVSLEAFRIFNDCFYVFHVFHVLHEASCSEHFLL